MTRPRRLWLVRTLAAALSGAALASAAAEPFRAGGERVFVEVDAPGAGAVERAPIPLVELRGRAGASLDARHDVAIALDLSSSTRLPSGVDVDGDGRTGASAPGITALNW